MNIFDPDSLAGRTDGRNVDPALGTLSGEASGQRNRPEAPLEPALGADRAVPNAQRPDYYGLPSLKGPVWTAAIPWYLFVGGVAGGASTLAAAARLAGGPSLRRLERRGQWLAAAGDVTSAALLISDLGHKSRFLNMLRVFRPTSPMNMGTWILTASGMASTAAVLFSRAPWPLSAFGTAASVAGLPLGAALTGYTGVLLTNTAVPLWQAAPRALPGLFMASAIAASASALELLPTARAEARTLWWFGTAGKLAALAATAVVQARVTRQPEVGRPLKDGVSAALWTTAKVLTAASLGLALVPRRRPSTVKTAAVLGLAGSLAMRFALFYGGKRSARDPQATFRGQRDSHPSGTSGR